MDRRNQCCQDKRAGLDRRRVNSRLVSAIGLGGLLAIGLGGLLVRWFYGGSSLAPGGGVTAMPSANASRPTERRELRYRIDRLPRSQVHVLQIPIDRLEVRPAVTETTALPASFAQEYRAIGALNGGFFDPQNQQSTSYVTLQGQVVADPTQNDRLMQNPDLTPYLDQILDRSELRRYQCGADRRYDIALHSVPVPQGCQLLDALGAGPQLLPDLTSELEGFVARDAAGAIVRDAIGSQQPNARSAIGMTATGDLIWVMVSQLPSLTESGMTLPELSDYLRQQGAIKALNLDGGSSSALWMSGSLQSGSLQSGSLSDTTFYGRYREGTAVIRPVKSVLLLQPRQ